jgi:hypothetical protein
MISSIKDKFKFKHITWEKFHPYKIWAFSRHGALTRSMA